jgi:hypothetical protein
MVEKHPAEIKALRAPTKEESELVHNQYVESLGREG